MITKDLLKGYINGSFRVPEILDRMSFYREPEKIHCHISNFDGTVFSFFNQYNERQTIRIEEDTSLLQKKRKMNLNSDEDLECLKLENKIFTEHIALRVSSITRIELDNCVFEKGLSVVSLDKRSLAVEVSCCIILSRITFNRTSNYDKISVSDSLIEAIDFGDVKYQEISINYSEVPLINMDTCEIGYFSTIGAHFNLIRGNNSIIRNNWISMNSFDTYKVLDNLSASLFLEVSRKEAYKKQLSSYKMSLKVQTETHITKSLKNAIKKKKMDIKNDNRNRRKDARNYLLNFINLLSNSEDLRFDIEMNAKLNYCFHRYKNNVVTRVLLYPVGYFYKPSRIIKTSITLILLFGIIFNVITGKALGNLMNSIYFSGITFFTIRYSDVFENSTGVCAVLKDILVLIEAGLGISLCSSLIASLINKYINK